MAGMDGSTPHLDRYELLGQLDAGGMAEILLARQHGAAGISRLVVIKRILPHRADHPQFVQMFLDEARLAAAINHPNVVQILDVGQSAGNYYIAMELIRGATVDAIGEQAQRAERPVPHDVAAEIVIQACDGLHAAHELRDEAGRPLGLVHRDLSPHNLMVTGAGVVKIVDFGVAKARTTAFTETGVTKGKCAYMSPEQCLGEQLHRASDIFSLGATYYELVVGQPLFACETDYMTQRAVIEAPIPSPRELRPDLPPEIAAVIARALQRDPEQRFRTAAELGATLRMVLEQLGALPSQRRLAGYIQEACAGLLEGQARAIQRLDVQTRVDARMPGAEEREGEAPSSCRAGAGPAPNDVLAIGAALAEPSSASAPTPAGTTANRLQHRARRRRRLALALLVTFLAAMGIGWLVRQLLPPPPPLRLGLSPEFTRAAIGAELAPFTSYLERRLGRRLEIVVDRGYDDLRMDLVRGELDLAALPHLQVIHARRGPVPPRIVAVMSYRGQTTYRSVFVTRDNSPARSLADLRGKRACWVSRGSASGFLMPRQALREQGYDPEAFFSAVRFSGSHPAALEDVIEGRCDVTATSEGWMQMAPKRSIATIRLRVLAEAGRIPLDHICVKRQLPRALREDLRRALLEFEPRRDIERDVIGEHFLSDGFAEPRPREFAAITRAMRREGILPAE